MRRGNGTTYARARSRALTAATVAALLAALLAVGTSSASAAPTWAPAATATIRPGVQTLTGGGQCTANFVFHDGTDVYLGQAAHCSSTSGSTETDGCLAGSLPLGTLVEVQGAQRPGVMVYNSWVTMQERGETDPNACQYNDLALVRLDPADHGSVNPTVPHWGGPVGLDTDGTAAGERVYSYGNSSLRFGITTLSPKTGISLGTTGAGWSHPVYTATPGVPGDSGSAFLSRDGRAVGVLSTLALAPLAGSNGVGDLAHELEYLRQHTSFTGVQLALGTEPFQPQRLPLGV